MFIPDNGKPLSAHCMPETSSLSSLWQRNCSMFTPGVSNRRLSPPAGASKYTVLGTLGEGRTGLTRLMKNKISLELVAAKWVEHTSGEALSKETEREIVNHRRLQHPNIIGEALSSFQEFALSVTCLCDLCWQHHESR